MKHNGGDPVGPHGLISFAERMLWEAFLAGAAAATRVKEADS